MGALDQVGFELGEAIDFPVDVEQAESLAQRIEQAVDGGVELVEVCRDVQEQRDGIEAETGWREDLVDISTSETTVDSSLSRCTYHGSPLRCHSSE